MSNYQPPDESKVADHYVSPQEDMNADPNKDYKYTIRTSQDDIESGLLTQSGTPPPPYPESDPYYDFREPCCCIMLSGCGFNTTRRRIIFFALSFCFLAWLYLGGMHQSNPTMRWYHGDNAASFYMDETWTDIPYGMGSGVHKEGDQGWEWHPKPHPMGTFNPGPWKRGAQKDDRLKKEEKIKVRNMAEKEMQRQRKKGVGERRSKPSNKPHSCDNLVWREGQLRTDGC